MEFRLHCAESKVNPKISKMSRKRVLLFAHLEALVGNKNVIKLLETAGFKNRITAIVVDEAHLVVDW